jgi:hypothetical protein
MSLKSSRTSFMCDSLKVFTKSMTSVTHCFSKWRTVACILSPIGFFGLHDVSCVLVRAKKRVPAIDGSLERRSRLVGGFGRGGPFTDVGVLAENKRFKYGEFRVWGCRKPVTGWRTGCGLRKNGHLTADGEQLAYEIYATFFFPKNLKNCIYIDLSCNTDFVHFCNGT